MIEMFIPYKVYYEYGVLYAYYIAAFNQMNNDLRYAHYEGVLIIRNLSSAV